jgi:hypothetical protein
MGIRFKLVTIEPDAKSYGRLVHQRPNWLRPDHDSIDRIVVRAERHIIISFAGQLAVAKFQGHSLRYGMASDNRNAATIADYLCGSNETVEAYLRCCWFASRDLINVRWDQIEALAQALLSQKTLKFYDALEVMNPGAAQLRALVMSKAKAADAAFHMERVTPEHATELVQGFAARS